MSLYLKINLLSILIPFVVSFHKRIQLFKYWKALLGAIFISMIPYIIWDIYFTKSGYWGFNSTYLSGINILHLPLEEWLFFICIPFACIFTHVAIQEIKEVRLGRTITTVISLILEAVFLFMVLIFHDKAYTLLDSLFSWVILIIVFLSARKLLQAYYFTFLFMLIPFLIVNGILTGSGIENEVVWYNNSENLGIRIFTIPIEDFFYAFSLILLNLFLFEKFKKISF